MKTCREIKSAAVIDAVVHYAETLLGLRFKSVKKNRYSAPCPFHADAKDSFQAYVNKDDEVRFHCFGACKGDWDICDLIVLRKKYRLEKARRVWAEHMGAGESTLDAGGGDRIPEPDDTPEPDDPVAFVEPIKLDQKKGSALEEAAKFYHDLLMLNENRFKPIWDYLASGGVGKDAISEFNIGYAPPYDDERHQGRALVNGFLPRFEKDYESFDAFADAGLVRLLNDKNARGYEYYCRRIDFGREYPFSRNYGDFLAGRVVFPISDIDARVTGLLGRRTGDGGIRRLKHRNREVSLSTRGWLYGIEKAAPHIRQYRTIILVEGVFDYFAFYNLLHEQDKLVVVSTLGSHIAPEAAAILNGLDIEHFIVAHDWDELGRNGIERMAAKSNGWVYYLGGPAKDQNLYDMLKPVVKDIGGFSLDHPF